MQADTDSPDIHGFVPIFTPLEVTAAEGAKLCPGHRLQRANPEQKAKIMEILRSQPDGVFLQAMFERHRVPDPVKPNSAKLKQLPEGQHRYWVIAFEGSNQCIHDLELALALLPIEIRLGLAYFRSRSGVCTGWGSVGSPDRASASLVQIDLSAEPTKVTQEDVDHCRQNYAAITGKPGPLPYVTHAIARLHHLGALPRNSSLTLLGLFGVIECIVTHNPSPNDPTDSLGRQIRKKVPMLQRRFWPRPDPWPFPPNMDDEKLWKELYTLRSDVAHGADTADRRRDWKLKNVPIVMTYLRSTAQQLILAALREPEFLRDIKEC